MNDYSFDTLARTLVSSISRRRGLGLLAAAGLLAFGPPAEDLAAKKRKKRGKKRKQRGNDSCAGEGTGCTAADFAKCCSGTCDFLVGGGICSPCRGRACSATQPCCGGVAGYCGGCRDRATSCSAPSACCFSDCTGGACLSNFGGRCARDVDCRKCYQGGNCTNACVNGSCTA